MIDESPQSGYCIVCDEPGCHWRYASFRRVKCWEMYASHLRLVHNNSQFFNKVRKQIAYLTRKNTENSGDTPPQVSLLHHEFFRQN